MDNQDRGMTPKEQRELARSLDRTVQWLRTDNIGIKPISTLEEIEAALESWYEADGDRIEALRVNRRRARKAINGLYKKVDGGRDE